MRTAAAIKTALATEPRSSALLLFGLALLLAACVALYSIAPRWNWAPVERPILPRGCGGTMKLKRPYIVGEQPPETVVRVDPGQDERSRRALVLALGGLQH